MRGNGKRSAVGRTVSNENFVRCRMFQHPDSSTGGTGNRSESNRQISDGQRGSTPAPGTRFAVGWRDELRCLTGVYVRRWFVETPWFSVRLHHWLHSDDDRYFHDHPWWFVTLVLQGSYRDLSPSGSELMTPGSVAFRPALHRHTVKVALDGCWTVLVTGPQVRRWGFWVGEKWKKSNKYFLEHGKHVCD